MIIWYHQLQGAIYFYLIISMGNKQFKHIKPPTFNKDLWNQVTNRKRNPKQEHGIYRILANKYTQEKIQEYNIYFFNLAQFQKYIQFFQWREREDNLVQAKFFNYEQSKQFCASNYAAKTYIEHIPIRLSDIQDIPYPQNVYVMHSCLEGFEKLYLSIGYFRVLQDLICMNRDGKVKVWMNPNLSQCQPYESKFSDANEYKQTQKLQEKMVKQIIEMIQENTTETQQYPTISQFIRQTYNNKGLTFRQAKREIFRYSQAYMIEVPNYFQTLIGVFGSQQSEEYQKSQDNRMKPIPYFNNQNNDNNSQISQKYANHIHRSAEQLSFKQQQPTFRKDPQDQTYVQKSSKFIEKIPSYQKLSNGNFQYHHPFSTLLGSKHSEPSQIVIKPLAHYQQTPVFSPSVHHKQDDITYSAVNNRPSTYNSLTKIKFNYPSQSALNQPTSSYIFNQLPNNSVIKTNMHPSIVRNPSHKQISQINSGYIQRPLQKKDTIISFNQQSMTENNWRTNMSVNERSFTANSNLNKLTYSDTQNSYELDSQIMEDMLKYLNF